ncbi:branched-chain amino acid ABC transporter permease [Peptoniphilus lacrimalis]|uniref:LIV-I protein H n=1 Tax=Peptoniphilus lacrimalis TaxID=33031 RepID=A0A379C4E8_9FIRM|nr:branched-chain amino acid ABC transporter permease [Peptoniphilus lacrimalis]SUB56476.1 LIV-I protein H [Peptoniphilus lacrimalis]
MGFILQIINGLSLGSIYALVALGYTMVYGIALLINFAHGEIIMIGAYTVVFSTTLCLAKIGAPLWLSIIPAVILCTILGLFIERVAYRPLRNSPRISNLITAIGVSLFLQNIVMLFFGAGAMSTQSLFKTQIVKLVSLEIPFISLITIVITAILTVALQYFMTRTKMGKALIATSEDSKAAQLVGINVDNAMVLTFGIGSALAGVAAVLYMGTYAQAQPLMGSMLGIKAFTAAVIGGIGLVPGAVIGGLLLGIVEALTRAYLSSKLADAIVFSILIIVLLIKPTGLLGKNVKEKV